MCQSSHTAHLSIHHATSRQLDYSQTVLFLTFRWRCCADGTSTERNYADSTYRVDSFSTWSQQKTGFQIAFSAIHRCYYYRKLVLFPWQLVFEFFFHFSRGNYMKITKSQIKLVHICLMFSVYKSFSSNGQIWPLKKPYITIFNWA